MELRFTWNPKKARSNIRDHHITFDEGATAFGDPLSITIPDPDHSVTEERFLLIGMSQRQRLLVISHVERGEVEVHLISARPASRAERRAYEEGE